MNDNLLTSYQFHLPESSIAQHPAPRRDGSRLMVVAADGSRSEGTFAQLPDRLRPGDLLIRNNVKVIPARLLGKRAGGGAAELLLVRREERDGSEVWHCLARPGNRFKPGREFYFGENELVATAIDNNGDGTVAARFSATGAEFVALLDKLGQVPLPPYIEREDKQPTPEDRERYQTHYAANPGAVAAPTAGLHFTPELDARLRARGIEVAELTLNVGPGTFRPIKADNLDDHAMDAEWYAIPSATWNAIAAARRCGGRVVAVGTTSVRALESAAAAAAVSPDGKPALEGWTRLFIRPGYRFAVIDGLVTNFHLPGSSLLVLVSALAGRERMMDAYRHAIANGYRFYSYGDAMLLWRPLAGH